MAFQINLATRCKPTPTNRRFLHSPSERSSLNSVTPLKKRPASAGVGSLQSDRKLSFRSLTEDVKSTSRPQSSSNNILRMLLSETINRQGDRKDSPQQSTDETESQSEEECPEQIEIEEVYKNELPHTSFFKETHLKPFPKENQTVKPFTQNPDTNCTNNELPDLPGRVSFSSNVFEIDLSDISDDSQIDGIKKAQIAKRAVHFEEKQTANKDKQKASEMDLTQNSDSSTKIIDEYKREIESLNRRHEEEMTKLDTEHKEVIFFNNSNLMPSGLETADPAPNNIVNNYLETIKETDSLEVFEQLETQILEQITPKGEHLERTRTTTWDNSQRIAEKANSTSSDETHQKENEVTEKVMDVKKEDSRRRIMFNVKKPVTPKNLPFTQKNMTRKSKANQNIQGNSVKSQHNLQDPKLRRAKSVCSLKEDLQDYEIDVVDSWMSINSGGGRANEHKMDRMRTLMLMKRPQSSHVSYNKEWRDTPTSRTDDEGNFSLEEANDCISNESTTYEELVSIIKEIEADKIKSDERKNIQADVEFTLNTQHSDTAFKDSPATDSVM